MNEPIEAIAEQLLDDATTAVIAADLDDADSAPVPQGDDPPAVWVLLGKRKGDNQQALSLASALGWPFVAKVLDFRRLYVFPNLLLGASLTTLRPAARASLTPPWPDVVVAVGRRSVPVARWIRRRSGGRTRLVTLGRPRAPLAWFDLVITTPQYALPKRANVLHNLLPLNRAGADRDTMARWREDIEALPRPRTAVLAGGNSWPFVLDRATAARLGAEAGAAALRRGGSLLVTTSPRTPQESAGALFGAIRAPHLALPWSRNPLANPYAAYLALADDFIVTADSASMMADACATGRPVAVFDLPLRTMGRLVRQVLKVATAETGIRGWCWARLAELGLLTPPRDLEELRLALRRARLIGPFGDAARSGPSNLPNVELKRTVRRVQELVTVEATVAPRVRSSVA